MKKSRSHYKKWYTYYKEMNIHYKELNKVAYSELKFKQLQIQHYKSILDEVNVLLEKGTKKSLIQKVIDLGKQRCDLDISIHFDLECGGIDNCKLY